MADIAPPAAPSVSPPANAAPPGGAKTPSPHGSAEAPPKPAEGDKAKETPTAAQLRKLKVYGQEREVSEDAFRSYAEKGAAADQRFFEAAKKEQALKEREARLKEKPWDVLREMGLDPKSLAEKYVLEQFEAEQLTPEQKRIAELEAKERSFQAQEEDRQRAARDAQVAQHAARARSEYEEKFGAALTKLGLPDGPAAAWALSRMAQLEERNLELGLNLPADVLAEIVAEDLRVEQRTLFGGLEGPALLKALGDELTGKVVKAAVAKYETERQGPPPASAKATGKAPGRDEQGRFRSRQEREFDRYVNGG